MRSLRAGSAATAAAMIACAAVALAGDAKRIGTHKDLACLAVAADGRTAATGGWDKVVRLFDVATAKERRKVEGHADAVVGLAFSPDGKTLATASNDRTARLWDLATGKETRKITAHTASVECVAFSPDGKLLVTGSDDRTVRVWDVSSGKELAKLEGHTRPIHQVVFSPDGKLLATGSGDETVRLWEVGSWKLVRTFEGHAGRVTAVAFAPDGKSLATGCNDKTVRTWTLGDAGEPRTIAEEQPITCLAFGPGGTIAVGTMGGLRLRDAASGDEKRTIDVESPNVRAVVVASGMLYAACSDGGVREVQLGGP